jgi:hypothetical protein
MADFPWSLVSLGCLLLMIPVLAYLWWQETHRD